VLTKDDIPTLADVVIANPTQAIYFPNLMQFNDLLHLMQLKPRKGTFIMDTPIITSSF
jgi:hypothetical protein